MINVTCKHCGTQLRINVESLKKYAGETKSIRCGNKNCNKVSLVKFPNPKSSNGPATLPVMNKPTYSSENIGWLVAMYKGNHQTFELTLGANKIGRDFNKCKIAPIDKMEDRYLGREHTELIVAKDKMNRYFYTLKVKSTTNGTYLNKRVVGNELSPGEELSLIDNDHFVCGETEFVLKTGEVAKNKENATEMVIGNRK